MTRFQFFALTALSLLTIGVSSVFFIMINTNSNNNNHIWVSNTYINHRLRRTVMTKKKPTSAPATDSSAQ